MKEIKAFIRKSFLEQTLASLREKGARGITVVTVHPVGYGFDSHFTLRDVDLSKKYHDIRKIEIVCDDEKLDLFVSTILECAQTGKSGDGYIFISEVDEVVKICTGKRGQRFDDLRE
jgi:nitrogen regulatory protein P-II 1